MSHVLTADSQVAVPPAIRVHLHVEPGQAIDYQPLPDGSVRMVAAQSVEPGRPLGPSASAEEIRAELRKWRGKGISKLTTDEIMRETRGDDSMR